MGIKRMKEAMVDVGLREPEFDTDGYFRAVFFKMPELGKTPQVTPQVPYKKGSQKSTLKGTQKSSQKILVLSLDNRSKEMVMGNRIAGNAQEIGYG